MKIAVFHELPLGGAKRAVDALAMGLEKKHEVISYETTSSKVSDNKGLFWRLKHDFLDLISLAWSHWLLARKIDAQGFDIVLVHPSRWTQAPFLLSFLKTPTVYYCQEPLRLVYDPFISSTADLPIPNRVYEFLNRGWRKWIDASNLQAADKILVNSRYSQEWVAKAYGRQSQVCYLGVDPKLFHPLKQTKTIDVLFFGTPVSIEGYDLLQMASNVSPKKWKVKVMARKNTGEGVTDAQLIKIINQSKVVVCLAHNEPFGLTVLEAMACGVPVIAINEGGYKESVVNGKTGILVPRDPDSLARAINQLLSDRKLASSMGERGRKHVLSFWTWEKSSARLNSLITKEIKHKTSDNFLIFVLLLVISVICSLIAILFFRQIRQLFPVPIPGPNALVGFATYYGYPMWFEPTLFVVLLSIPVVTAQLLRWLFKPKAK